MPYNHTQSIKEVIKHYFFKAGAGGLISTYRDRRGYITEHLQNQKVSERFRDIYKLGVWVHEDNQESRSGRGSGASVTDQLVTGLPILLKKLECVTLLDVGCGDWNWMTDVELPCNYIGVDIVPEVIDANKQYERDGVSFILANASEDELPQADVVLCREVLFHLSFEDGKAALSNIKKNAKWLIATTDNSIWFNSDIHSGDFRNINLQFSPYKLPLPNKIILDDALSPGRVLGVWKTSDL
jgi:2-polyprenyl-3-methyl-5-hydroxy-6-metoxy-1,4-benzoquinol methylase